MYVQANSPAAENSSTAITSNTPRYLRGFFGGVVLRIEYGGFVTEFFGARFGSIAENDEPGIVKGGNDNGNLRFACWG